MDKYKYPIITNACFRQNIEKYEIKDEIIREYSNTTKEALTEYAIKRKILPFVAMLFCNLKLDNDYWFVFVDTFRNRNAKVLNELDVVFSTLKKNGAKKVFVSQNFGALLVSKSDLALFASGDVDLCGSIEERIIIERTFSSLRYKQVNRYCGKKLISSNFYNDNALPIGFSFGIEYDTISRMKLPNPIDMDTFVNWHSLNHYRETSIVLPSIECLLYICLVHISLHSFSREPDLRLYIDIENCLSCNPNLYKMIEMAKSDRTVVRSVAAYIITCKLFDLNYSDLLLNMNKYKERINHLLKLVYDSKDNTLIYGPSHFKTLLIECAYYDNSCGILQMLFPNRNWIEAVYGTKNPLSYIKHILGLFK